MSAALPWRAGRASVLLAGMAAAAALGLLAGAQPLLAYGAALGTAFFVLALVSPVAGLSVVAFVAALEGFEVGGVGHTAVKLGGLALALAWLVRLASAGRPARFLDGLRAPLVPAIFLLLAWLALSLSWAQDPARAGADLLRYALNAGLLVIALSVVRERRHVVWLVGALVAAAAVGAVDGFISPSPPELAGRLSGVVGDPNELALNLVGAISLGLGLAASPALPRIARVALGAAIAASAVAVLLTASRGGLIAAAVGMLVAVALGGRRRARVGLAAFMAVVAVAVYVVALAPAAAREHITQAEGGTGRSDLWTVGLRMAAANPVEGVGLGNFSLRSADYLVRPGVIERDDFILQQPKVAHNLYVQVLAELGVVGAVLLLGVIALSLGSGMRAARRFARAGDEQMELLARAAVVALAATLAGNFFLSGQFGAQLWLLLAIGPILLRLAGGRASSGAPARTSRAPRFQPAFGR